MIRPFDPRKDLIVVPARIIGPAGTRIVRLALDTGATQTAVDVSVGEKLVLNLEDVPKAAKVTTASSVEKAAEIVVNTLEVFGLEIHNFPILCQALPISAGVDGVLGLDFFRGRKLTLDFRLGWVTLE